MADGACRRWDRAALAWGAKQGIRVRPPRAANHRRHRAALLSIQPLLPALLQGGSNSRYSACVWLELFQPLHDAITDGSIAALCCCCCCSASSGFAAGSAQRCTAAAAAVCLMGSITCRRFPVLRRQPAGRFVHLLLRHSLNRRLHALACATVEAEPSMHQAIKVCGLWQTGGSSGCQAWHLCTGQHSRVNGGCGVANKPDQADPELSRDPQGGASRGGCSRCGTPNARHCLSHTRRSPRVPRQAAPKSRTASAGRRCCRQWLPPGPQSPARADARCGCTLRPNGERQG